MATGSRSPYPPISDYALLSDCHGSALVSRDGGVDWCCLTRFDARPIFARLLDWERGGTFRIAPEGDYSASRHYRTGTNVLDTRFETAGGVIVVTDFLVMARAADGADEGGTARPTAEDRLIRLVRCEGGSARVNVDYRPRFNFGRTRPHLRREERDDVIVAFGGPDALVLQGSHPLEIGAEGDASASLQLTEGEAASFVLSYAPSHQVRVHRLAPEEIERRLEWTVDFWSRWSARCTYNGRYAEAVQRSALVLKALTNVETGAIVAAPTTSLAEQIGGVRNWDYRYTWLRDASFVVDSLFVLGYRSEGHAFMQWLQRTTAGVPEQLQIMYGEGGENLLPEITLEGIHGWRGSAPVRIGNAASEQFQLDVYGEVLHAAWRYRRHGGEIGEDEWRLLRGIVDYVERVWERSDAGLWEVRSEPEHFVHSKVMSWVAVDRGMKLGSALGHADVAAAWEPLRDAIRDRVLRDGVRDGRFVRAFGADVPDASSLLIPLEGLIPIDDPRSIATREWVEQELVQGGLVRRYRVDDGLPGSEGAFVVCSFWLVEHLARSGERERARALFERLLRARNDVGLLAEEISVESGEMLGNFPQALSHIGLINAAVVLDDEERGAHRSHGEAPGPA